MDVSEQTAGSTHETLNSPDKVPIVCDSGAVKLSIRKSLRENILEDLIFFHAFNDTGHLVAVRGF